MAASGSEKSNKKKTEKKLAAREEAKLLASFMGVMNTMRKQVRQGIQKDWNSLLPFPNFSKIHSPFS